LRSNKSLEVLDLADNNLGPKGIEILKESIISNKTLHELKVNNNNLGSGNGSKVIAEILKLQESLKKLDINASFALDNHKSWSCNRDLIDGLLSDN